VEGQEFLLVLLHEKVVVVLLLLGRLLILLDVLLIQGKDQVEFLVNPQPHVRVGVILLLL
jgi:hypothetical protein